MSAGRLVSVLLAGSLFCSSLLLSCASGSRWAQQPLHRKNHDRGVRLHPAAPPRVDQPPKVGGPQRAVINAPPPQLSEQELADAEGARPSLRLQGAAPEREGPLDGRLLGTFRNTYYDFPAEFNFSGTQRVAVMGPQCQPIREVPLGFYEALCVQGSGTLQTGATVSFSRRDCDCAQTCAKTGQKICFDELDQDDFPWGRGALGQAIVPLQSVAVDSDVVPLGSELYIPEYDGVPRRPSGAPHDGCFVAEDRGMKVVGKHVDVFTGNPSITQHFNELVPSNQGVRVYLGTARCQRAALP